MKKHFYLVFFAALVIFTFSITSCKDLFDSYELTVDVENSESGENTPIVDSSTGGSSGGESAKQVYTITYQNTGDADLTGLPTEYTSDTEIDLLNPITSSYSSFDGWYRDSALTDKVTNRAPAVEKGSTGNIVFYAKWTDTLEVTAGGSSTASPFDTLNNAIAYINTKATQQNINIAWTVLVEGSVTGNTVISELKASSLTIRGKSGADDDILTCDSGSVIAVTTPAIIYLENIKITGGKGYHDSDTGDIYGGGIYIEKGTVTISNSSIKDNGTSGVIYGGGIYVATSALLNISGCNITSNGSENAMGGGIYNEGKVNIFGDDGNYIKDNNAEDGGGIYNASVKAKLTLEGFFEISENTTKDSSGRGGGIFNAGIFEIREVVSEDSSISGNTAAYGGGVYTRKKFTMAAGAISANLYAKNGGGVYNENGGEFIMTGGYIDLNTAVDGGGVYNEGLMKMYGTASIGNEDSWDGDGNAYVNGCCNSVSSKGGEIYNSSTGNLTLGLENITDSQDFGIYFNYAAVTGGGIFTEGECNIYGGVINYNGALTSGVDGVAGTISNADELPSDVYIQDITNP